MGEGNEKDDNFNPIPKSVRWLWEHWNVRGALLFSLTLQILLILFAPFRKRTSNKWMVLLTWSGYLLADATANFGVGLISNSQDKQPDSSKKCDSTPSDNGDLLAFWSPFLLLHLGGPDTITAFALEDNQLWLRHLLALLFQVAATGYVFAQTLPSNKVMIPTALLFLAGIIKYLERTRSLYLAYMDKFRDSMLSKPDAGPNYAKFMEEYASKKQAQLPAEIITIGEPDDKFKTTGIVPELKELDDREVVVKAFYFFKIFRGLIVDLIFSFKERNESRDFFNTLYAEDALRVIEVELNFIYDVLFTKAVIVYSNRGKFFRFVSFCSVVAALAVFRFHVKKHGRYDEFDVGISYALLFGAIFLDTFAFFMSIRSDWTVAAVRKSERKSRWRSFVGILSAWKAPLFHRFLSKRKTKWLTCESGKHEVFATSFLFRRWSGSVSRYNLIRFCLKERARRFHKFKCVIVCNHKVIKCVGTDESIDQHCNICHIVCSRMCSCIKIISQCLRINIAIHYLGLLKDKLIDFFGLKDFVDELTYVCSEPLTKELWEFIFGELKNKSQFADDAETAKEICSARGDWVLQDNDSDDDSNQYDPSKLRHYIVDVAYDQSILLWHIATDLLYNDNEDYQEHQQDYDRNREFSTILSDYMLFLLVMQPTLMAAVAGIGKIRFQDTCEEAKRFFKTRDLKTLNEKKACKDILEVNTDVDPIAVKGDRSKSVLFDASRLAKELKKMKGKKWKIVSRVWVELLSYAASHCRPTGHAQQVSKGGELLTFVWLLMAHFGIGEQFQINEGHARAKLIVDK